MLLRGRWIRRITFLVVRPQSMPAYFTFRERLDYQEDAVIRYEPMLRSHAMPCPPPPACTCAHTYAWVWSAAVGTWSRRSRSSWSSSA